MGVAVAFVSAAAAGSASTSVAVQTGDLVIVVAAGFSGTTPALPDGWVSLGTTTGTHPSFGSVGGRVGWARATAAGAMSTGTWTGAAGLTVAVYRQAGTPRASITVAGAPALTGFAAGSWAALVAQLADDPAAATVAGLADRGSAVWDSNGASAGRATTVVDAALMVAATVEIPYGPWPLAATVTGTSTVTAAAAALTAATAATVTGTSTVTAAMVPGGVTPLPVAAVTITGTSTVTAALGRRATLPATVTGTSTVAATSWPITAPIAPTKVVGTSTVVVPWRGRWPWGPATITATSTITAALTPVVGATLKAAPRSIAEIIDAGGARRDRIDIMSGPYKGRALPVISASLTIDETAQIRATGTIEVAAEDWVRDILDPRARTELSVVAALEDDEGQIWSWPLALVHATARPYGLSVSGRRLSVQVADRAHWVARAGMRDRRVFDAGTDIAAAATTLLSERAPWLDIRLDLAGYTFGTDATLGELGADPWKVAADLMGSLGRVLYIDPAGVCRAYPATAPIGAPIAASWAEGTGTLSEITSDISDDDLVNVLGVGWKAIKEDGQADEDVPGGIVYWVDEVSSASVQRIGERVRSYGGDESVITSAEQAKVVAESAGLTMQGIAVALSAPGTKWDPRVTVGDVVHIRRPELDVDLETRITGLSYTLGGLQMDCKLAERRLL